MVATYPRRSDVPRHLWTELLRAAERDIAPLAFAGLFPTEEHPDWLPTLSAKGDRVDEVRQPINICLRARVVGGDIRPEPAEAAEVRWVDPADLDSYPIHPAFRTRITHGLTFTEPYIG